MSPLEARQWPPAAGDRDEDEEYEARLAEARAVIRQAVDEFGLEALGMSYNGGKDSVVMLYLILEVLGEAGLRRLRYNFQFAEENSFPEMTAFIARSAADVGLELHTLHCADFRSGLQAVADRGVRAVFMGTRKTDPDGRYLRHLTPCSPGWPPLVRVCPILGWSYHQVWRYIHENGVPYCSLYDRGYTSIGTQANTVPNPLLLDPAAGAHRPAALLADGSAERVGRRPRDPKPGPAAAAAAGGTAGDTGTAAACDGSTNPGAERA